VGKYEIEDGAVKANGSKTWRALIHCPRPQRGERAAMDLPQGTICIRGPSRLTKQEADSDGEQLERVAASGDMRALRDLQQKLTREQQLTH